MSELSIVELESEHAELLPERETLFLNTYIGVGKPACRRGGGVWLRECGQGSSNVVIIG